MEKFTFGLRDSQAESLEKMSNNHGPGFVDYLLETHVPDTTEKAEPQQTAITEWIPKIGVDATNKSVEIDVGSQVIVVNLADFYKPRDAAQLFGAPADPNSDVTNGAASGLDLLASTANMYRNRTGGVAGKKAQAARFVCGICQTRCGSQMALRIHYGAVHGTMLHACKLCGQSFIRKRDLDKHECDDLEPPSAAQQQPRVPPLVVRPPKGHQPRRLEDTSSDEEEEEDDPRARPPPAASAAAARRALQQQQQAKKRADGKKEAYVCRVCQSKFRDPQSVLNHLKQFHPEHAMKAWKKFQENLKSRRPGDLSGPGGAVQRALGAAGRAGADTFAVRSVTGAPMKLKLSRSLQQQQQQHHHHHQQQQLEPDEYAVLPSEIPAVAPGQREPIYHQTQYKVYQPPDPLPLRPPSPPPDSGPPPSSPSPGYVTCGVCGGIKYYTYTDQCRLYGSFACESCRKFIARFNPAQPAACLLGMGQCHIPVLAPRNSADKRCRACWLKKSLLAFNLPEDKHDRLRDCLPPSIRHLVPAAVNKPYKETGICERDTLEG